VANDAPTAGSGEGLLARYVAHRHTVLFYSLLATLVLSPALAMIELTGVTLQAVLATNVLAAILGLEANRGRAVLVTLTIAILIAGLAPSSILDSRWSDAAFAFWAVIGLVCAAESLRFAMRARSVDSEHVYAALSVYLLAGTFFGVIHWSVEHAWPGSYVEVGSAVTGLRLSDALYFSFVTLASLGYGDIVPVSDLARGFAVLEAVGGQLYLAALVSRLVGAWMQPSRPA
jgi:voltage-gated potassium channel